MSYSGGQSTEHLESLAALLHRVGTGVAPPTHRLAKRARRGFLHFDCPKCATRGKYHMGYGIGAYAAVCWQCGRHPMYEVLRACGVAPADAAAFLSSVRSFAPVYEPRPTGAYQPPPGVAGLLRPHREYLMGRGYDPDALVRTWGIGAWGANGGRWAWRLFVPVTLRGRPVSWTTRGIGTHVARWLSANPAEESMPRNEILYGVDYAGPSVLVFEGPTDVWRVGPGCLGTFGLEYSPAQAAAIARFPRRAICFDNTHDAQRRADILCRALMVLPGETVRVCLDAADPGEASADEVEDLRRLYIA